MIIKRNGFVFLLASLTAPLCIQTSQADESYNTEVEFDHITFEDDSNNKEKVTAVTARMYFQQVNVTGHPYEEAAFLERVGSIELGIGTDDVDFSSGTKLDGPIYGAAITYVLPESPIVLGATLAKSNLDYSSPLNGDYKTNVYNFGLGYFFADGLFAFIDYTHRKSDVVIPAIPFDDTFKRNTYEVGAKFVQMQTDATAINIEGGIQLVQYDSNDDDGSNIILETSGDYYFTRRTSLGAGLEIITGDEKDEEGKSIAIDFRTYISPTFAVNVEYEQFFADNAEGEDSEILSFGLLARF